MDSVAVAFELMRMELDAEVENLNTEGAKFFRASMYADAEELITKGKALQAFLDKVRALEMEWTSSFAATVDAEPADPVIEETARKILSGSKASKTALLVRFPNGDVLAKEKAADTLVEVIQHAGMEQVEAIGIMVNGENIVSRTPSKKVLRGSRPAVLYQDAQLYSPKEAEHRADLRSTEPWSQCRDHLTITGSKPPH